MRVLVLGGSGLIGRALAHHLVSRGHLVTVLSRRPERARGLPPGTPAVRWDPARPETWAPSLAEADALVNLAGESIAGVRWSEGRKRLLWESRVGVGQALVRALALSPRRPRVLVQASAVGYYGPRGDEEVDEATPPGTDFLGRLAVAWEASTAPAEGMGLRRVVVRTGLVLSREGGLLAQVLPLFRLGLGGTLGPGTQWWPWIHIQDHIRALAFLLEHPQARGPFNLTAPAPVRQAHFARALARALGRPALLRLPTPLLRLALGEVARYIATGQRALPRRLTGLGFRFLFTDLEQALADLLP